jgi:uncharacterized protein YyaL (SSP411 family)
MARFPPFIMKSRNYSAPAMVAITLCGLALITSSCRKGKSADAEDPGPALVISSELAGNGLGALPGAIYRSQAESPIHWQPWTKESLERAKDARRLVFCVIAMPQQPGFQRVLASLERDSSLVAQINGNYVPILVDGDASREIGLLTADLCAEIKRSLQLPLFVWMTYEGNPVAWIPVAASDGTGVAELFNQSHTMVSQMWDDDMKSMRKEKKSSYVLKNSGLDNANRRSRLEQRKVSKVMSEQPAVDVVRSLRQLASLYDPYSRSFDEAGGLFPASSLELLAMAAVRPGLPADVRARCLETTRELLTDLLPSPMFDPLDGGVFSSRRGASWALPSFVRDCPGQARVVVALIEAYRATGNQRALANALGLIAFAEKTYGTPEGLFAVGLTQETDPEKWMWSVEDIERELGEEDAAWWIKATAMKGLGNLPSEADPQRDFFRYNTMGLSKTTAELAAELGLPVEGFTAKFDAARAKLLAARNARLGKISRDECSHAGATFRMVSAYAAAFGATGDGKYREQAVALLKRAREAFGVGPHLRNFSKEAPESIGAGRAFLYALALQSVVDVATITSDEQWLVWSEDLATTAAEMFSGNGFLKECPDEAKLIDLPVTDLVMLFDDSTAGLVSSAESRLVESGRPLVVSFSELATPLPTYAMDRPILHTDLLAATVVRHYKVTVVCGADLPSALKTAVERLPMRSVQRRPARPDDQVPAGSVKVLLSEGDPLIVSTPEALQQALLPSPSK